MQQPLQISAHHLSLSPAAKDAIRNRAAKLERFYDRIISCHVTVDAPHQHKRKGESYYVHIIIGVPGAELAVKREPHEDLYVSIRDAFDAAQRELQDYARRRSDKVRPHAERPKGRISKLFVADRYGFIATDEGREIYFHENSVVKSDYDALVPGAEVYFSEEMGENGPQATSVIPK